MQRILFVVAMLAASAVFVGCPEGPEAPHLLYSHDAQSQANPFPDLRLVKDGTFQSRPAWYVPYLRPDVAKQAATVKLLNTWSSQASIAKGFGNLGITMMNASEPLDPSTLAGTVVRLHKVGSAYEVLESDVAVEHATDALVGTDKTPDDVFPGFIVVRPSIILPEGEDGLLVVKKGIKTASGTELGRGREFEHEAESADRIKAAAKALGVKEEEILLTLPLKAESVTEPLKALAEYTKTMPAPQYTIPAKGDADGGPVGVYTTADAQWNVMRDFLERHNFARPAQYVQKVVVGTFKARDLRETGIWKPEWMADPNQAPLMDLYFTVALPAGPKPAGGWRTVIGAHGLNGLNSVIYNNGSAPFCLEVGEMLAKAGFACIGIDAASHGRRGSSFDFFSLDNLTIARDNFRQTAFDMMQLSRLAQSLDLDGDGSADLSPELGYFGNSLGGIMGANFLSFDPRVKFGVLNVPGGGLSNILTSPVIRDQVGLLLVAKTNLKYQSLDYYASIPVFRVLGQLMLEQGDPINLGQAMDDRPVLVQMGVDDLTIPNLATLNLCKTLKAPEQTSNKTDAAGLRVMSRMDPKVFIPSRATGYNGHNIFWETEAAPARNQAVKFLQSKGTEFIVE